MNMKAKKSMVVGKADGNPKFKEMAERVHLKSRKRWPAGKRPANDPQVVNPIKEGGAK